MQSVAQHFLSLRDVLCHDKLSPEHRSIICGDIMLLASKAAVLREHGWTFHDGSKLTCHPTGWELTCQPTCCEATPMSVESQQESLLPLADELRRFADGQDDYIADLCNRAADGLEDRLTVLLEDAQSGFSAIDSDCKVCRISADCYGIYIRPEGYGDYESPDGEGCPVIIEYDRGDMRVLVWDDINDESPTHIISLEGAREDAREIDEDNDQT